ncbi:filamentous haemagglutinin family protein [Polaromonas sp. YR568]|uniref:filamentous haemagglutinin family protein n=1 Tax=Polaromonas sp. YR568 TaxID=1855301 RepID=UPI00398BF809
MSTRARGGRDQFIAANESQLFRMAPIARAIAVVLAASGVMVDIHAQQAFGGAWFAAKGAAQNTAVQTGLLPNGTPASLLASPAAQQQKANAQLQRSIDNLNLAARGIAAQQAAQAAARLAAANGASVPDGLAEGGLKVDTNSLTAGWANANAPVQSQADGRSNVVIQQTADKAILNWETFNVGRNTTVDFRQDASWAVLNRVNDPNARPSQIQGQVKGEGTVMVVNRNGVIFSGSSQVNTGNLVAAAARITDAQFNTNGIYSAGNTAAFTNAQGKVEVQAGARIATLAPRTSTEGGGYVLLLGQEVNNAGEISTPRGQAALAAGDNFLIRKGNGTDGNPGSTTRGNEVTPQFITNSLAGKVSNSGLIVAREGDVTMAGRDVQQGGVALATSTVNTRGTVHLNAAGTGGKIVLGQGATTAVVIEDDGRSTALDGQRDALIGPAVPGTNNIVSVTDRRDQSRIEITSGGTVDFQGDSLTLATGGQIVVSAAQRSLVRERARLDVSGAIGVNLAMESNNVKINVQGNEQRDAPGNRDNKSLNSNDLWIDRRTLVFVPKGTNGYESDRWYTAGGLLEVGGYLGTQGHTASEWMAQGGTVSFGGNDVVTQAGSNINLSGGTLNVQSGYINLSWLKGADGRLYELSKAPGDQLYTGVYRGFEDEHLRWGKNATEYFYNPLIGPQRRLESGYTAGRDAGKLVIATNGAVLEGDITSEAFQGARQTQAPQAALDGYDQSHNAAARRAQLIIGQYLPMYDKSSGVLSYSLGAVMNQAELKDTQARIAAGLDLATVLPADRQGKLVLDTAQLNGFGLGAIRIAAKGKIAVNSELQVAPGGEIVLYAPAVDVAAGLTAHGGAIRLGNVLKQVGATGLPASDIGIAIPAGVDGGVWLREGVTLDATGLLPDLRAAGADPGAMAYINGGTVSIRSTEGLTLAAGSLVDVSSGAVVKAGGSITGGSGGSVQLGSGLASTGAGNAAALLSLDGRIRGHGVKGGGTLDIESASAISIGGQLLKTPGVLGAGESVQVDLVLDRDVNIAAGKSLPIDYSYRVSRAAPGEAVGSPPNFTNIVLAAAWTLPYARPVPSSGSNNYDVNYTLPGQTTVVVLKVMSEALANGRVYTLPAGAKIVNRLLYDVNFPVDYVVPANVFPGGIPVMEYGKTAKAGTILPFDALIKRGTVLKAGSVFTDAVPVKEATVLSTELFRTGFSQYTVRARNGLAVPDGLTLEVLMPVLRGDVAALPAGGDMKGLLQPWLPELYQDNPAARTVAQRRGAGLSLAGGMANELTGVGDGGNLYVGEGAAVRVDPGQSLALSSRGSLTVDGLLQAQGGRISVLGPQSASAGKALEDGGGAADGSANTRAIVLGRHAVLDASAASHIAYDTLGRPYGVLTEGGSITLGGTLQESGSRAIASDAFVVIREGAVVDVSGGQAQLNLNGAGTRTITSDGGSIQIASASGLYLDGALRAFAGGAGASGGSLVVALEAPNYALATVENAVMALRDLTLVQRRASGASDAAGLQYGRATLGVDQVRNGGFSSLALYSNGAVSFGGDVDLSMGKELRIYSGALAALPGAASAIKVSLSAPYILLAGITDNGSSSDPYVRPSYQGGVNTLSSSAVLDVHGKLIDIKGVVTLGLNDTVGASLVERAGFGQLNLDSEGDLRFVKGAPMLNGAIYDAELNTTGDILLRAAQVYPATGVSARILAGRASTSAYKPAGRLLIERHDAQAAAPALPYSVFGSLILGAAHIEQNGVLRAPLGSLQLGTNSPVMGNTTSATLAAGSLTSVSAAGLVMPYGGTADGVNYSYLGTPVALRGVGSAGSIEVSAQGITVEQGALLDLSGGGDLLGAGFVSGRGGSTDARMYPLMRVGSKGFTLPGLASNPVYAIVPGYASAYAPAGGGGAVDPRIGQQVTIGANDIPGLAAGTYVLLPSHYALLPGAFRVEVNGAPTGKSSGPAVAMRNGSYNVAGTLGIANTGLANSLSSQLTLTPADVLRSYSQYNETSYADFVLQQAALAGTVRAMLPADAKALALRLPSSAGSSLSFEGRANFAPGKNGYGGTASIATSDGNLGDGAIEILGEGAARTAAFNGLSLHAGDLNAIGATRLVVGGNLSSVHGVQSNGTNSSNYIDVAGQTGSIVLRQGAILKAPEVFLVAANTEGGITVETGAGINTIGMGKVAYDSTNGYIYRPGAVAVVAASNGWLNLLAPEAAPDPASTQGAGSIAIGACGLTCTGTAQLYSEGTLLAATRRDFELSDSVRYGTRNLVLAVGAVNAGSNEDLAAAAARGALTSGLTLNQTVLNRLLRGDTAYGAPALERLVLTAAESVNFFGSVSLDTTNAATGRSSLDNLVLSTPAIYGYGGAGDVASITTGKLTWAGLGNAAPAPIAGGRGTGSGTLAVNAGVIEFGYDSSAQPNGVDNFSRTILGFADARLTANERITANHKGSLSVYQSQIAGIDGPRYQGGSLTLTAPLVTGAGGSVNSITAGGALQLLAPAGGAANAAAASLAAGVQTGAELNLTGNTVRVDTTVALPSGKLDITADGDITLGGSAWLDLAGRELMMHDVKRYSWGGDVTLRSTAGNITQAAGSIIDLSARNNNAGLLSAIALAGGAGRVNLQGTLLGSASGHRDAGGTLVPYRAGGVNIRAQHLGSGGTLSDEFAAFNTRLNGGAFLGERSFQLKQGDLTIGDELRAGEINVSLDNGRLTVAGTVDASGEQVGSIRLAAANGLTLANTAVLDAHGTVLRVDSYGKIIDSPNRAMVELDAGTGTLTLAGGARIDLRHGTGSAGGDGKNRGTLDLYAARIGSNGGAGDANSATYGDIAIDARGNLDILGARSIAVYGKQVYKDAPYGSDPAASGRPYQVVDQAYLGAKHNQAVTFINAALANGNLLGSKLAGLNNARYRDAFHLRPAMEIASATPDGDLVVQGDLDLSGYRYASLNPNTPRTAAYGSGEVGMLTLRAGGDLSIYGSINDGFAPPPATPDDSGWILTAGVQAFGGDLVVPVAGVTLADGTTYPAGKTLNYAITARDVTLPAGTVLPGTITLSSALSLPAGTVLAADVRAANGSVLLAAGTVVGAGGLALPAGAQLLAGARLPVAVTLASLAWPKGAALPVAMVQAGAKLLPVGALIASGTNVVLPAGALSVDLRPADSTGRQARNWAVAQMLPEGSQSWSMRLVAGADTQAADNRLTRLNAGSIVLADSHYSVFRESRTEPGGIWYWGGGNTYGGAPGTPADDWATDPSYNLCAAEPGECVLVSWLWTAGNTYGGTPGAPVDDWALDPSYNLCEAEPGECAAIGAPGGTVLVSVKAKAPVFSVLRTGTGDLDLAAGRNFSMQSPYGVYTAGTQTRLGNAALDAGYNQARGLVNGTTVLGTSAGDLAVDYENLVKGTNSLYKAWYPDGGGNLWLNVGGDLTGDSWSASGELAGASSSVGNWLWRQGTGNTAGVNNVPTAWWINFGTYAASGAFWPALTGFTGVGTLGGGDATIRVGGDAGVIHTRSTDGVTINSATSKTARSEGLVLAIGSTGRVLADNRLVLTGGGDLDLRVGGGWNSSIAGRLANNFAVTAQTHELYGGLVNLRGAIDVSTGQVGTVELFYGAVQDDREVRASNPYASSLSRATGGLMVMAGDAAVSISSRGDLVLGGTGNAGLVGTPNATAFTSTAGNGQRGQSWFSLWTDRTALQLLAAGGNLAFDTRAGETIANPSVANWDYTSNGGWFLLPGQVSAVAGMGSIYYGKSAAYLNSSGNATQWDTGGLLLAPLGERRIDMLAGDSLYGGGYAISASGADASAMATVFRPAFAGYNASGTRLASNASATGASVALDRFPLLAFGLNSVGGQIGVSDTASNPSRFYAVNGDIIGLRTGTVVKFPTNGVRANQLDYVAAGPVAVKAGRDIVYTGNRADETLTDVIGLTGDGSRATPSGNLVVHTNRNDVSVVQAGRDILYANFNMAGPGTLEISAGRNLVQNDKASIISIGPVAPGDSRPGAGIVVQAGLGAHGANYTGLLNQYLNPANLAQAGAPLAGQQGKVAKTYENELAAWLSERYGFKGTVEQALAYFNALAPEQQRVFARQVYFAELREGGREYNDADSPRSGSYLRGRNAIAALFPGQDAAGNAMTYQGNLLMYGGSGIRTNLGGDIQVLTPGGAQTYGVEGAAPPATAGLITRGKGNIQLYSLDSILLGQSRIMTTFGGDILAWSAQGDINAGRGSKTTVVYTPPRRVYDQWGNVAVSPDVPSTGAGIATLNPIPEIAPGDVDLIAPLGTIDAGEAGIRVSGNVNLAALQVVNAANIAVKGDSVGIPAIAAVNVGALTNASAAASQATVAAQDVVQRERVAARSSLPSIFTVRVIGFGNEPLEAGEQAPTQPPRGGLQSGTRFPYDAQSFVQIAAHGDAFDPAVMAKLSEAERRELRQAK